MTDLFTKENITFALSVFGSIGALFTFINSYLINRKRLKITLSNIVYNRVLNSLIISAAFENKSQLPIAITALKIKNNKSIIESVKYPAFVGEYTHTHGTEVVDRKFEYNLNLPLDIDQLSAKAGCVLFDISPREIESLSTPLTLLIYSTRGRVQKIELQSNQIKWI